MTWRRIRRIVLAMLLAVALGLAGSLLLLLTGNPVPREAQGWAQLAPLPVPRGETAVAVAGGRLYVIGGLHGLFSEASALVSVYDPRRDAWEEAPALPASRHHAAAAGIGGTVYVSGGGPSVDDWAPQPTVWALDPGAATWREVAPMPAGRLGHRMVEVGGRLYVVGGVGASAPVLIYDPDADAWSMGASMSRPRDHLAVVAVDGLIWAIGGRDGGRNLADVDVYDPAADSWRPGPALPAPTSGASEGAVDGLILVSGGEDPAGGMVDGHWQLDTSAGADAAWQPLNPPPLVVHGAHGATIEGRLLIVGGALRQGSMSRFAWTSAAQAYDAR